MIDLGKMTLRCPACKGEKFLHPPNAQLDTEVTCSSCGQHFKVIDLVDKKEATRLAADRVREAVRKLTKR